MRRFTLCVILAFLFCLSSAGEAFAIPQKYRKSGTGFQVADQNRNLRDSILVQSETSKIMSVLAHRIDDPKILAKTRDKLLTLRVEEIRLLASLCDRIPAGNRSARSDMVFSLVTTLIVFS